MNDEIRPFSHVASIDYPILDADAHVNEPPNLWQDAVPAKWKERAPKLVKTEPATCGTSTATRRSGRSGSPRQRGRACSRWADRAELRDDAARGASTPRRGSRTWTLTASMRRCSTRGDTEGRQGLLAKSASSSSRACARTTSGSPRSRRPRAGACVAGDHPHDGTRRRDRRARHALKNGHRGAMISSFPNGSLVPERRRRAVLGARAGGRASRSACTSAAS